MTRLLALIVLVPFLSVACSSATSTANEFLKPPLKYSEKVGDKAVTIPENETVQLLGAFTDPTVSVTPHPCRVFSYQGLRFNYPRSFTFEADLDDPNARNWTLSGNDLKIMYFVINASLASADFANTMIGQFGRENAKVVNANATIALGDLKLAGTSLTVTVATHKMVMDIYSIPSRDTQTKLLVFQDSLDASGNRSREGDKTIAEIKSSFVMER